MGHFLRRQHPRIIQRLCTTQRVKGNVRLTPSPRRQSFPVEERGRAVCSVPDIHTTFQTIQTILLAVSYGSFFYTVALWNVPGVMFVRTPLLGGLLNLFL